MLFNVVLLFLLFLYSSECSKCPSNSESWCRDVDGQGSSVVLQGNQYSDLKLAFQQISLQQLENGTSLDKDLDHLLVVNNSALKSLDKNAFGDFRFTQIVIQNCTKLNRVHVDAFEQTKKRVRSLKFDTIGLNDEFYEDFFEALNTLERVEVLELFNHNFRKILPYTFRQEYLYELYLKGPLDELQNNSFYYLDNIHILRIQSNKSLNIQKLAFDMKSTKNETVHIYLEGAFKAESGIFTNNRRPLRINLSLNKLTSFESRIFRPILMSPLSQKSIILYGKLVEAEFDQCQFVWLFKEDKLKGTVTFKDEPEISLEYFEQWHCNLDVEDEYILSQIGKIEPAFNKSHICGGKSQMFLIVLLLINILCGLYGKILLLN